MQTSYLISSVVVRSGYGSGFDLSPWCGSGFKFLFVVDADPNPTFHPDVDPDPDQDPSFQRLIFHAFCFICKLMRIRIRFRIQLITLMLIRMRIRILIFIWCGSGYGFLFDADADLGYQNDADPCRFGSGSTTLLMSPCRYLQHLGPRPTGEFPDPPD